MKIVVVGGGPAGLYFSILMKKAWPDSRIQLFERNRSDDTFGWGVVFSDETLGGFQEADPETYEAITGAFRYWSDIHTWVNGELVTSTGHGFCGMSRKLLLQIFQERCSELGVEMHFETEIETLDAYGDADLIVAADGINSFIRDQHAEVFRPSLDWRRCKFAWFGTDLELEAFTFIFKENQHGLFQVHAYPFDDGLSTFIVECREEVWLAAGLDEMDEEESAKYCEELFAEWLGGHKLLINRSLWRTFPTVRNECWHHDNIVIVGDAAHTAHFSIGSGTKLAMEDAIELVEAFKREGISDVPKALASYQEARYIDTLKLQKAAQTSLVWFEQSARYLVQDPISFQFNLMTRSKRITYDNLELRDPALVAKTRQRFMELNGDEPGPDGQPRVPMFSPYKLRELELDNRIVVSPMCQYSATEGLIGDWHLVHLGSRAIGGAGLVISEMTDVSPEGRITPACAGIWTDEQGAAWKRVVDFCHANSTAKIGIQLAHAGRKGSVHHPWNGDDRPLDEGAWTCVAPSAMPFQTDWPVPKEMDRADMDKVVADFVAGTSRALDAGFDLVELHMAHGYLLSSFLSPLSNQRTDDYGGSLEKRMRFPLEVFDAVRAAWPEDRPLAVRISATDWLHEEGMTLGDSIVVARALRERGCDLIDVSTAGNDPRSKPVYGRMYQVPFAERIRYEVGMPTMAVGAILGADHANTILAAGRADLCAMARPHLADPYLTFHAAQRYDWTPQAFPGQYLAGRNS